MHSEHFKQKSKDVNQNVTLYRHHSLIKTMNGLFKYIGNRARFARALSQWDHLGTVNFRTRAKKNGTLCKSQTLFVKMSLSDVDSVRARKIMSMQMAVLSLLCVFFFIIPLSVTPIRILPVNKNKTN